MADAALQYSSISLGSRGGVDQGQLKLTKQGFAWRRSAGGKNVDVKASEVSGLYWTKLPSGCQLGVRRGEGSTVNFLGFKDKDFEQVKGFCREAFSHDVVVQEMCLSGHNWGSVMLNGSSLMFMIDSKVAFEVPLPDVSGVNQQKDEVMLEFQVDDTLANDAEDTLVEMAFHVPVSNQDYPAAEEGSDPPAKLLSEQLLALTDAGAAAAEEAVCGFDDVAILAPRGRFAVEMHLGFLKLSGQTQEFKIRYSSIVRLFLLPKPNSPHTLVVVSLDPPIRKGNTYYSHLLCQFTTDDEDTIELDLTDEQLASRNEKYNGKLDKQMSGRTFEVFARIIRGLSGAKLTRPGNFENAAKDGAAVRCTYKADDGYLFPLERAFFYVHKPPLLIVHDEIDSVEFMRQGGGVLASMRTFDLLVRLKNGSEHQFRSIQRSEWQNLLDFLQAKKLRIENLAAAKQGPTAGAGRGVDLGDDLDPGMAAAAAEADDEDEEEDEDFSAGDESGSDSGSGSEEDSDDAEMIAEDNIPAQAFDKKKAKREAEAAAAADDSGLPSPPAKKAKPGPKAAAAPKAPKAAKGKAAAADGDGEAPAKKGRKKKDPNAPKAGLSAFMYFSNAVRASVKADNPGIAFGEVGKIIGEKWKALSAEDKAPYEAKAAEDKARYRREMEAYKAGQAGAGGEGEADEGNASE